MTFLLFKGWSCSSSDLEPAVEEAEEAEVVLPPAEDEVYDETGCLFTSYTNLVMAGYQGWFAALEMNQTEDGIIIKTLNVAGLLLVVLRLICGPI